MNHEYKDKLQQEADFWSRIGRVDPGLKVGWYCNKGIVELVGKEMLECVALAYRRGGRALDLCCGTGGYAERLAQQDMRVDAYDISEERIQCARQSAKNKGLQQLIQYDIVDLNHARLPEKTYDSVLSHDAIHHIANLDHLLEQVAASLKDDGVFVVYESLELSAQAREIGDVILNSLPESFRKVRHQKEFAKALAGRESPFEGVSSQTLVQAIYSHFDVVSEKRMLAFAPHVFHLQYNWDLSLPEVSALAKVIVEADKWLVNNKVVPGSCVAILARRPRPGVQLPSQSLPSAQKTAQQLQELLAERTRELEATRREAALRELELKRVLSSTAYRFGTFFSKKIAWLKRLLR